ncbi:acetamidase/formamidase family protein [Egibacter rhizosphaerae]|uniref:acetamidase/formamidase family protein n=1 Tax=Egibacter rhizosphaerae TaxID=1670831 RepID=UPI001F0EEDFA|nr:acetamidase/formamidase family protein [Egibacter rhizosphaerae]
MRPAHTLHAAQSHAGWDRDLAPELEVAPGTTIALETHDASGGQLAPGNDAEALTTLDFGRVNPTTGPVRIDGAQPGDALAVRIEALEPTGWGWTANIPGFGLLADDFPEPALRHWDLTGGSSAAFGDAARVPLRPFPGTLGVAPAEPGPHSVIPPRRVGGNMDTRDLVAGTTVWLPVEVEGALFSLGDTHAAQGDGEVCGTAIESPMTVTVTLDVVRGDAPHAPVFETTRSQRDGEDRDGVLATTGVGPDLFEGAKEAVRAMIELLGRRHGLEPVDAYLLCSVVADLRISEIVDQPNYVVTCAFPRAVLT